ncbi:MAG: hypothetical protein ACOYOP_06605 [Microthrixaceae bacterium]
MHPIERLRFVARARGAPAELLVEESASALSAFRDDPAGLVAACRRIIDRHLECGPLWWLCARMLCAPDPFPEARAAVQELHEDPTARLLAAALADSVTVVVPGWPEQALAALGRRGDVTVLAVDSDGEAHDVVRRLVDLDVVAEEVPARAVATAVAEAAASGGGGVVLLDALAVGPDEVLVAAGGRAAAAAARAEGVPTWVVAGAGRLLPARMYEALVGRWSASVDPLDAAHERVPMALVDRVAGVGGVVEPAEALRHTDCPVAPELFRLAG